MTPTVHYREIDDTAVMVVDAPPLNLIGPELRNGIATGLGRVNANRNLRAAIVIGANDTFIAGADLKGWDRQQDGIDLRELQRRMELSSKPIIAALAGFALGGGVELALAATYRVAHREVTIGFPEVTLGLIPGAGGTQRLPRLIGADHALDLMLSGRRIGAEEAVSFGLADAVTDGDLLTFAVDFARRLGRGAASTERPRPTPERSVALAVQDARRSLHRYGEETAPAWIVDCVEAALTRPEDLGFQFERTALKACRTSDAHAAMTHLFFATRIAGKAQTSQSDPPIALPANKWGRQIAARAAAAGVTVFLDPEAPDGATRLIKGGSAIPTLAAGEVAVRRTQSEPCWEVAGAVPAADAVLRLARRLSIPAVHVTGGSWPSVAMLRAARRRIETLCLDGPNRSIVALELVRRGAAANGPLAARCARGGIAETDGARPRADISDAVFAAMADAAGLIVARNGVARPADIDVIAVHACDFPRALGGPLWWRKAMESRRQIEGEN